MPTSNLRPLHQAALAKAASLQKKLSRLSTPCYLFDQADLMAALQEFTHAFQAYVPHCSAFYAVKSNHYEGLLRVVVREGMGLEVASGRELAMALRLKAKNIIFNGPGKTDDELTLALKHTERVIVNLDSVGELGRLSRLARARRTSIRAGIRIHSPVQGAWQKFGIPLEQLPSFWRRAHRQSLVQLQGIHFHLSWNRTPEKYVAVIKMLGSILQNEFTAKMQSQIQFLDIGGGLYPHATEGTYPWTAHYPGASPAGKIMQMADAFNGKQTDFVHAAYLSVSQPVDHFAREIGKAIGRFIRPIVSCAIFTEPGRILSTRAMHMVVRVVDVKSPIVVITDGGVNMQGREFGELFYHPIINLTHPAAKERLCTVFGPLCTPRDIWGYRLFTGRLSVGDLLLVPFQGAYCYSLAQAFIKEIPPVIDLV